MIFRIVLSISFASQRRKRFVSGQWDNRNSSQFKMVAPVLSDFKIMFLLMPTFSFRKVHKSLIKKIDASGLNLFSVGDEVLFN